MATRSAVSVPLLSAKRTRRAWASPVDGRVCASFGGRRDLGHDAPGEIDEEGVGFVDRQRSASADVVRTERLFDELGLLGRRAAEASRGDLVDRQEGENRLS